MPEFVCRVDADDKITHVDDNWTRFAAENGLPSLTAEKVAGVSLWNFVTDLTTRHLYRIFMNRARRTGRTIFVPFRCDSPDRRRFMLMAVRPLPDNGVEFDSELLREEIRPKVNLLDPDFPRRNDFVVMCSWCKKVKAPDWVEVEEAVERLNLFNAPRLPWVSHGICPECEQRLKTGGNSGTLHEGNGKAEPAQC